MKPAFVVMKSAFMVVGAMLLYGVENAIIERHLSGTHPLAILFRKNIALVVVSGLMCCGANHCGFSIPTPSRGELFWIGVTILTFFAAECCFYGSYYNGASSSLVTACVVLIPIFTSITKAIMHWGTPNRYTVCAWICGAVTICFAVLAQKQEQQDAKTPDPPSANARE